MRERERERERVVLRREIEYYSRYVYMYYFMHKQIKILMCIWIKKTANESILFLNKINMNHFNDKQL